MSGYLRPVSLAEGLTLINENTRIVAGATDVYPARTGQHAWGKKETKNWLDITGIAELQNIQMPSESATGNWHIGALVTWSELIKADLPPAFDSLKAAGREVGGRQIQNRATVVGNVCNASPAADGVPPLLCLNASVEISSLDSTRYLPLPQFIQGNRQTALQSNEIVTALCISRPDVAARGYFYKLGARKYLVISIVMIAAVITIDADGTIKAVHVAVGSCSSVAIRLTALEQALIGTNINDDLSEKMKAQHFSGLSPIDDVRSDAAYRRVAAAELVDRLLLDLPLNPGSQT